MSQWPSAGGRKDHTTRRQEQLNQEEIYDDQPKRSRVCRKSITTQSRQKPTKASYTKLAGKMRRAEKYVEPIRSTDSQEIAEDFLENGNRLWQKFKQLLKECDQYMWRAAMTDECSRHIRSSNSQGMMEGFLEGYHLGGLHTKPIAKALTEPDQSLWNEVGRTIPGARLHRFTSPLHIPMAKVLLITFAFCTPPDHADIAISEH
jgi:hypothetical protein